MELRKDPVTQSWMLVGDEQPGIGRDSGGPCEWCAGGRLQAGRTVYVSPGGVRVYPHPHPLYQIEGTESRTGEGIYDRMRTVGAHEVVLESATHDRQIVLATDREAAEVLNTYGA